MSIGDYIKKLIRIPLHQLGYDIINLKVKRPYPEFPLDFSDQDIEDYKFVFGLTMVPPERLFTLTKAIEHVLKHQIPGDLVECGVWRGGCSMHMVRVLHRMGEAERRVHLFDLFDIPWPSFTKEDRNLTEQLWTYRDLGLKSESELAITLEMVQENMKKTGVPEERYRFVRGMVEETLPDEAPEQIAILRLDTDLYNSTKHELEVLYPRLSEGGILIIDDYGAWTGAKQATDEYIEENNLFLPLFRVDSSMRMAIKPFRKGG